MSAGDWLLGSIMAHLAENAALDPLRVFDFVPARAGFPYAVVEDPVLEARDVSGLTGRVGAVAIACRDGGERPERLRFLLGRLEDEMATLPADLGGEGWRLAALSLQQSRIARGKDGWVARSVWAVRVYRANA